MTDSPTSERSTLVLERRIAAPVSLVYSMLIDPNELRHWLGPNDCVVTQLDADVRVGGRFEFRMQNSNGSNYAADGVYKEIVTNERVVLTWRWKEAPPGQPLDRSETLVSLSVRSEGSVTILTLLHSQLPDETSVESHGSGWNDGLDKLVTRIEKLNRGDQR
jgi:uncharacterized protein YndB with AHSA1/START domain